MATALDGLYSIDQNNPERFIFEQSSFFVILKINFSVLYMYAQSDKYMLRAEFEPAVPVFECFAARPTSVELCMCTWSCGRHVYFHNFMMI